MKEAFVVLTFNPDGSIEGYNTPETVDFFEKLGSEVIFREDATIHVEKISSHVQLFAIFDSSGHNCPLCGHKKSVFIEVINENALENPKIATICEDCLTRMRAALDELP